ncbi:MAG: tRNA (adenosine(37)-N6)-threonylcarbamoyltransferase complex ATPase subunit type 1 TsaE [Pseudomonadaceae bacterium]|nr:tRNA (adenosine(37)-N6)-threonylcarbamoyltransferase complex ATPase subunit type 1 TsaE [Pseudomonadaceae bacterium]
MSKQFLADEAATEAAGAALIARLAPSSIVYLSGDLGAGKTTFVRGMLRSLGYSGAVKSPTYTLLEPYEIDGREIYHFDLYRINDPEELLLIGIDELMTSPALKLIEWPEQGGEIIAPADVTVSLAVEGTGRTLNVCQSS